MDQSYNINDLPIDFGDTAFPSTSKIKNQDIRQPSNLESDVTDEDDDDEDGDASTGEGSKPRPKFRKIVSKLSPHLKGLMGEAHLRYARGDLEVAKKMCFEVIRQAPDAFEPYLTLSQMYENDNSKKYHGYLMLASHLCPSDESIWCRLAEVKLQNGLMDEAISCYSSAIRANPKNVALHMKRLHLLEQRGDNILMPKMRMAKHIPRKQYESIIQICMEVAKEFYNSKRNYAKAIEALKIPLKRVPTKVPQDLLNMMLEMLLLCERYTECLDILNEFCGFEFDIFISEDKFITINSYVFPHDLQVDLKVKFIICVIYLKSYHLLTPLIDSMLVEDNVEKVGDLYLDIVEALMNCNRHCDALKLLVPLVKSANFSLAAVWLKYAECLSTCNMVEPAIEAYFTVMALAPRHIEVFYPLAMLLLKQNKKQEALDVLSQDLTTNKIDVAVLIERMKLLKQINEFEEYWKCAELLLSRHCLILKNPEELKTVTTMQTFKEKAAKLRKMRLFRGDYDEVEKDYESIREPSVEEEYELYREILQLAKDKKEYGIFQKLAFTGLCSKKFQKKFHEILLIAYYSCLLHDDSYHGYSIVRDITIRYPKNNLGWNWFTMILQTPDDIRHSRYLDRFQKDNKLHKYIEANYCVSVGGYMAGLSYFMKEFKQTKSSYSALMLGVVMTQLYSQRRQLRKSKKKMLAEIVTYLFLNYANIRSTQAEQEVYYNLGRMYQQLGVTYLAEYYYNKVFKVQNELLDQHSNILCLKREAAFNLHLIYKNNGNKTAARNILLQHIVI